MSTTVSVRLDDKTLKHLDIMAKAADRSRAWLMSQAIAQYVEHEAWQIEAIDHSIKKMASGDAKFVAHNDVTQWLKSWGKDDNSAKSCTAHY